MPEPRRPRVVVCRTPEQAGDLARRLEEAGCVAVVTPVIALAAPEDGGAALRAAVADVSDVELVVLTSPNAARQLVRALIDAGSDADSLRRLRVMTVGPGTAATATALGLEVWRIAARHVAEGVLEELAAEATPTGRVLLPQAAGARPLLRRTLAGRGWRVDAPVAYRTAPVPLTDADGAAVAGADAVAFTSASTVDALVAAVGPGRVPPVVVTLGPETSRAATRAGLRVSAEADPHTIPGLVDAVVAATGGPRPGSPPPSSPPGR